MDKTYSEFEGTEFDPSSDFEFDDEQGDLVMILSISAVVAAVVGAILVIFGRMRKPTPQERAEELLSMAGKQGKKGMKSVTKAVEGAKLGDLLDDALSRVRDTGDDLDVGGTWDDLTKRARKLRQNVHLGSMLEDASSQARKAAGRFDFQDATKDVKKRVSDIDIDAKGVEGFLDTLKEKVADAIDSVRSDVAPKATDRLKEDIFPAAAGVAAAVAQRVREDVVPAAQKRAGKLADEHDFMPRAQKVASSTKDSALSLADVMRGLAMTIADKVISDVLPGAKMFGGQAVQTAREDVLPKVSGVASQTPEVLSDVLQSAMNKVEDALHAAQPVASDAFEFSRHKASDVASGVRGVGSGVGDAVSSAGRGVTGAVGSAVGATASVTKETTGILFWASMLGGLILLAFVPDKDKQKEIWNNAFQFMGEIREMWTDLQGVAGEPDTTV